MSILAKWVQKAERLERELFEEGNKAAAFEEAFKAICRATGVRVGSRDKADDGCYWASFPLSWSDKKIEAFLRDLGWPLEGHECHSGGYDCCGRIAWRPMWIQRRGSRALAKNSWYRDV